MFRNYFISAWRNLKNNTVFSLLNILGLATGMAVALIIGLWVHYQYSYDRFLPGYKQAYQARSRFIRNGEKDQLVATPLILSGTLKKDIPEIEYAVHTDWMGSHGLVVGEKKIYINGALAEPDFLKIFPFPIVKGNRDKILKDPYSIVLTASTAKTLFGNSDPIGQTVRLDNENNLKVTGILEDLPGNSSFQFNYIIPFSYAVQNSERIRNDLNIWDDNSFQTYVALKPGVAYAEIEPKLKLIIKKYDKPTYDAVKQEIFLQPFQNWHLYSDFKQGVATGGFIEYVRMSALIGIIVLLIACINFMNLSTARSEKRAREVGVRKTLGSGRKDLVLQFLLESIIISFIAFFFSILIVQLTIPAFNLLTETAIHIPYANPFFWLIMTGYVLLTGLLAGSRPAFYLSSFQPVKVLKGTFHVGKSGSLPRKMLVVLQFSCSIALIISTIIIYQQIQYAKNRSAGYDRTGLLFTNSSEDLNKNFVALKSEMLGSGLIESVTQASSPVTDIQSWSSVDNWQGKLPDENISMATVSVGADYFKTVGMEMSEGKKFYDQEGSDSASVILNEAAVKRLRFTHPIGQIITWDDGRHIRVTGVVKDALMLSPFNPAEPSFFLFRPKDAHQVIYRLKENVKAQEAIRTLTALFNKYNPSFPYTYHFVDERYASKFNLELLIGKLSGLFAGLAIFISCLGLFGLAAYTAEQRSKEIGIRKVLGATVTQVWMLLSKDFLSLIGISCVIASATAFYVLSKWLLKYDYRISIGPVVFIIAAGMALLITMLTISFQAVKAAVTNPVDSLRAE